MKAVAMSNTLEVLFTDHDSDWNREMPVTLITYPDGRKDLHRQTSTDFTKAVQKAKGILAARGLEVGKVDFIGPTGAYMEVTPFTLDLHS